MEEQDTKLLLSDLINVANVFPNIHINTIYNDLNNLAKNRDRVEIILKKYLAGHYIDQNHKSLTDDILIIKKVVQNYPVMKISRALSELGDEKHRVQIVLRMYFEEKNKEKKSLECTSDNDDADQTQKLDNVEILKNICENVLTDKEEEEQPSNNSQSIVIGKDVIVADTKGTYFYTNNDQSTDTNTNFLASDSIIEPYFTNNLNEATVIKDVTMIDSEARYSSDNMSSESSQAYSTPEYRGEELELILDRPRNSLNTYDSSDDNFDVFDLRDNQSIPTDSLDSIPLSDTPILRSTLKLLNVASDGENVSAAALPNLPSTSNYNRNQTTAVASCSKNEELLSKPSTSTDNVFNIFYSHDYQNVLPESSECVPLPDAYIPNYELVEPENCASNNVNETVVLPNLPATSNYNSDRATVIASCSKNEDLLTTPSKSSASLVINGNTKQYYISKLSHLLNSNLIDIDALVSNADKLGVKIDQARHRKCWKQNELLTKQNNMKTVEVPTTNKPETNVISNIQAELLRKHPPRIILNSPLPAIQKCNSTVDNDVILVSVNGVPSESSKLTKLKSTRNKKNTSKPEEPSLVPIDQEEPCTSGNSAKTTQQEHPYFYKLMEMFPDICPDYLRKFCNEREQSDEMFEYLISFLLSGEYKRRVRISSPAPQVDFDEQYRLLLDLFPDADPTYLQHQCERLIDNTDAFKKFVAANLENKTYPSKAEYLRKLKLSAQEKQYTTEFDVKKFLEIIPDPEKYFQNPKVTVGHSSFEDCHYALVFLKNHYSLLQIREISQVFKKQKFSVVNTSKILDCFKSSMKCKRKTYPVTSCTNIPLLQEIAYVAHKQDINKYIELQKFEKIVARKQAKEAGLLKTCGCCFDEEIMPNEIVCCEAGHEFCMECVKIGSEVLIGEQKLQFPCLQECKSQFNLHVLQMVLAPKVFSKLIQRKTLEEVKAAGIDELESCPFCDFATIPAPGDKLFRCLNDDCMKESCRSCREPSHIPLRCDEVEKEKDVQMRTYIEDKMTEALIRKCYKCGMKFVKEDGCNKMTCSCGAMMCYICKQPVTDYKHFNGQGGGNYHLCPLYSDTNKLHIESVKRGAETAKKELGLNEPNKKLKIDPAENLERHFKRTMTGQLPIHHNANGHFF